MKFSRITVALSLAAAALLSVPFGAQAQGRATVRPSILSQTRQAQTVRRAAPATPSYNYVGIGGGDDGFSVNSKFSVSNNISIRPEVATDFDFDDSEDVSYLVPVTYDFTVGQGRATFNPFVGAGVSGSIGDDSDVEFATVAGVDYRFANNYVANGSIDYAPFADDDEVGFNLGIGYAF